MPTMLNWNIQAEPYLHSGMTHRPWVKYLFIVLNQPPSKEKFSAPPDRNILDPYPSVDMVPDGKSKYIEIDWVTV